MTSDAPIMGKIVTCGSEQDALPWRPVVKRMSSLSPGLIAVAVICCVRDKATLTETGVRP
jgi:hypothetical protein